MVFEGLRNVIIMTRKCLCLKLKLMLLICNLFIVRQDNQSEDTSSVNPLDTLPLDQFSNEGQPLNGPFKVPSNVLKKQYLFGNRTKDLTIVSSKMNIFKQKINYSNDKSNLLKNEIKEKRKPTVSKNSKPKQQVIQI